jgi:predicted  nucleic acid-binding Zn-ribbon protein
VSVFDDLLAVQDHDTAADRLRHRRATLAEREPLAAAEAELARLDDQLAGVRARLDELARTQGRLEDQIAGVTDKIVDVEKRLYSGEVSAIRELQAMQADVESLGRHRARLEDEALGVMETREPVEAEAAALEEERADVAGRAEVLAAAVADAERVIDGELAGEEAGRAAAAAAIPADLLEEYERLRAKHGGVGVARLDGRQCLGCHLTLPATELDAIRKAPPEAVVHCEQCGRILVR